MKIILLVTLLVIAMPSFAHDHLVTIESQYSVAETADRLENIIKDKGLTFFTRIDHAENAKGVGLELKPTQLILFGNPKVGTLLMQCQATVAIDLPQKALVWQDDEGKVWFSYNNPEHLKELHSMQGCEDVIEKISGLLSGLALGATSK
jgi:uncharacterized protein (DUF302 family)